jgi:hypothetical protein
MPLLDTGTTIVQGGSTDPKPALMFKVPEHIWQQLGTAALTNSRVKVSLDGGIVSLDWASLATLITDIIRACYCITGTKSHSKRILPVPPLRSTVSTAPPTRYLQ